jgi:hypothetical protein
MFLDVISSYNKLAAYDFEKLNTDDFFDKLSRKFSAIMMIVFTTSKRAKSEFQINKYLRIIMFIFDFFFLSSSKFIVVFYYLKIK